VTTTATPTRCTLADIANHQHVIVEARITAVDLKHEGTSRPWAVVTLTADGHLAELRVYPTTYALTSEHLVVGNRVVVSAETATDADGTFMAAHTIGPAGDMR
jgi:DNA polymerase III alpha subunit